jgi:uroporphyrinogen-III synthase
MTILITRPQPDAMRLAKRLQEKGYSTLMNPLLRVDFINVQLNLKGVQAILTTSINGIRAMAHTIRERDQLLYTVGPGSANEAKSLGFKNVKYASGNTDTLIQRIQNDLSPTKGKLIYVCGDVVGSDIVERLVIDGFGVEKYMIYHMQEATKFSETTLLALKAAEISLTLFFSPRTVDVFIRLLLQASLGHLCKTITALCLSSAVVDRLKCIDWKAVKVADRPSQTALLTLIPNYIK